ncbi:MAG: peptidase M17 [Pseudobacteriovorax sp.]|nr:peptidase M17 [Pseudobacteriovorax sp.]
MDNLLGTLEECQSPAYDWVGSLDLSSEQGLVSDAWNVVVVTASGDSFQVLSSDLGDLASQVTAHLDSLKWKSREKTVRAIVDGVKLIIAAKPVIPVNPMQLGRQIGINVAKATVKNSLPKINLLAVKDLDVADVFEGFCIGMDKSSAFQFKAKEQALPEGVSVPSSSLEACKHRKQYAAAMIFTKWLQDAPSNFMNSEMLAEISESKFRDKGKLTILGREEMKKRQMGAFLAVASGADVDPKLVTIEFEGKDKTKTVALVGKGVTFDAGGINMKPTPGLEEMKYDMSGAAAVLGAAHYFAEVQPPVNVVCAIGAVENMPSSKAIRPGDVVKSASGKTIEILNTDAEGRLVLADVLTHVVTEHKPQLVIDIATLTGAVLFGLGHAGAAYMTAEDKTAEYLNQVGSSYGEALWRLPLWPELGEEVKSELADLKNLPKPNVKAGTIMGGWFLYDFVKDHPTQWAHVDIAGTAWNCSSTGYMTNGGSGFGVRTLIGACEKFEG